MRATPFLSFSFWNDISVTANVKCTVEQRSQTCKAHIVHLLVLHPLSEFFKPLTLRHYRSWVRCGAAIRLSHRPEPSGRAVHEEVGGLDIGGHVRRFVLRHTHRPKRRPYPICCKQERKRPTPVLRRFMGGSFRRVGWCPAPDLGGGQEARAQGPPPKRGTPPCSYF